MKSIKRVSALWFAVASLTILGSLSANASDVVGKWQGNTVIDNDKPMFVFVDITSLTPDENVLTLKYGHPISCSLLASYGGSLEDSEVFYFSRGFQARNWCDLNILSKKSEIRVSNTKTGKLKYDITSKGVIFQSVVLNRVRK